MNYEIEARQTDDLIIVRHYHYYSAADLQTYLDDLVDHLRQYPYRRLLVDYSGLTEVKLDFFDKLKIIVSHTDDLVKLCRHIRQATVTINDFQKGIAQQGRSIGRSQCDDDVTTNVRYFNNVDKAMAWLMEEGSVY